MLDPKRLDELARNLATAVPGVGELQQELERTFQALLQSTFAKLELVTREEFEVQAEVLARSRARLEQRAHYLGRDAALQEVGDGACEGEDGQQHAH